MSKWMAAGLVASLALVFAVPALAAETATARDVQVAVDSYVASAGQDASLVGGPGSAGYDSGFWIRGGDFSLRINATLQARYEYWDWAEVLNEPAPGGDLSGFSLPRATLKLSGTAPCNTRYYMELEFGHPGNDGVPRTFDNQNRNRLGPNNQSNNYSNTREAWIEWGCSPELNFRMGQIAIPTTRQLMTDPELQQFVDISLASAVIGSLLPGYTDRNRDHGAMFHGAFGCNGEFSYMLAVTNGDSGDSIRNIWDVRTDDNLAFSGRLNWAFLKPIGYEESALRQNTCEWYGEFGVWAHYQADRLDRAHFADQPDWLFVGADLALGYGGFSFTSAFNYVDLTSGAGGAGDATLWTALVQLGFLFPDSAWEIAARWSNVNIDPNVGNSATHMEFAGAVNYYLNGHGNKLTLDVAWVQADSDVAFAFNDLYTGYHAIFADQTGMLVRFQWQLAL
jgi:hypothetical protein